MGFSLSLKLNFVSNMKKEEKKKINACNLIDMFVKCKSEILQ